MAFSPENLKIRVNSREIHAFIQTATYPPFTKGTWSLGMIMIRCLCHFSRIWASGISRGHVTSLHGAPDRQGLTRPMEHDPRSKQVLFCCVVAVCVSALFCLVLLAVCALRTMCR